MTDGEKTNLEKIVEERKRLEQQLKELLAQQQGSRDVQAQALQDFLSSLEAAPAPDISIPVTEPVTVSESVAPVAVSIPISPPATESIAAPVAPVTVVPSTLDSVSPAPPASVPTLPSPPAEPIPAPVAPVSPPVVPTVTEPVATPVVPLPPQRPPTFADHLNVPLSPAELATLEEIAGADQTGDENRAGETEPLNTIVDSYYSKLSNYDWSKVSQRNKRYYDVFATLDRLEREYLKLTNEDAIILKGREIAEALFAKPTPSHIHIGKFCREAIQAERHGDSRKKKQYMELLSSILYYAEHVHHISDYDLKVLFSTYQDKLFGIQNHEQHISDHLKNLYVRNSIQPRPAANAPVTTVSAEPTSNPSAQVQPAVNTPASAANPSRIRSRGTLA